MKCPRRLLADHLNHLLMNVARIWGVSLLIWLLAGLAAEGAEAKNNPAVPIPPGPEIIARLKPEHPRLLATAADFAQLRERVKSDARLRQWRDELRRQAEIILKATPSKYEIPDGLRLLATSRQVVQRIQTLGLLYQLDGDKRYADRAWQELDAAANFKDWNPRHFLDTAEMTHAFALGYDWFHAAWTPFQRAVLRAAMVEKGIKLALQVHKEDRWWAKAHHNWNQVCNGGIGMGALAIGDEEPELAGTFLNYALKSLQLPMAYFAPDGAWNEGPGYWNYATTYNVVILAALQTALGTDYGLSQMPGFAEAGMFPIYASGPMGTSFNYADAGSGIIRAPQMFWMARQFHRPAYAAYQRPLASPQPLDLLWDDGSGGKPDLAALPLDKYFRNAEVAMFRSAWDDRNALFVGFKSGDNQANHSNLDLGSFVLDALGVRWAVDLGSDNYNLPGYFGPQRWTYYRLRAEGHNTLVINPDAGVDQDPSAAATIARFESKPDRAFAITDLTPAYARHARKVQRGMAVLNRQQILVQDEIQTAKAAEVWWFLHTVAKADVEGDGSVATLTLGGKRMRASILSPKGASFTVMDAQPLPSSPHPPMQNKNNGIRKLAIHLSGVTDTRLAVQLVPVREGNTASQPAFKLSPLAEW